MERYHLNGTIVWEGVEWMHLAQDRYWNPMLHHYYLGTFVFIVC